MFSSQFIIVESVCTTISDLFPQWFRAPVKHEIFVLILCVVSFLAQLILVTEVRKSRDVILYYVTKFAIKETACLKKGTFNDVSDPNLFSS